MSVLTRGKVIRIIKRGAFQRARNALSRHFARVLNVLLKFKDIYVALQRQKLARSRVLVPAIRVDETRFFSI